MSIESEYGELGPQSLLQHQQNVLVSFFHQHEAVKMELTTNQGELDHFSSKAKQLVCELNRIPDCETQVIKTEMEAVVDQWLDVSTV